MNTSTSAARRVWLIIFDRAINEYGGRHPHLEWLGGRYELAVTRDFGQMHVYSYTKINWQ